MDDTMENPSPLFSLHMELLEIIFNMLGTEVLLKTEPTSKTWQKLTWSLASNVDLTSSSKGIITDTIVSKVLSKTNPSKLRSIEIHGEKHLHSSIMNLNIYTRLNTLSIRSLSASTLSDLIPKITTVRNLDCGSGELQDQHVNSICEHISNLTELHLNNTVYVTALSGITRLTKLDTLNLAFSEYIKDAALQNVVQLTQLRKLDLCWLKRITGEGFQHISKLSNLVHLDISNVADVKESYFTALTHLPNLVLLDLSYYKLLTDRGASIIGELTTLTRLVLVDSKSLTESGIIHLSNLSNLVDLSISGVPNITTGQFLRSMVHLTSLKTKLDENNGSVLNNMKEMVNLNLSVQTDAQKEFFENFAEMTRLDSLVLRGDRSYIGFDMLTDCTNLTHLQIDDVAGWYGDTNDTAKEFMDKLVRLTNIRELHVSCSSGFAQLAELPNLELLNLTIRSQNELDIDDFEPLNGLPNLASLNITSPWTETRILGVFQANKNITSLRVERTNENE